MRTTARYLVPMVAGAGAVAAILTAPAAVAQPEPTLPTCVDTGGAEAIGGSTTECATPGNVSINATPAEPAYEGPWGGMWEGDGYFFP
jgi:hypothetical protein